jgi:SAM-dependent methyltransferase
VASNRIAEAVRCAWRDEARSGRNVLDLSVGSGETARMLAELGFNTVATEYSTLPFIAENVPRVAGVNLNYPLPFKSAKLDGVNLTEVIEHIENQAQLVREIARVLKPGGVAVISTPNVLNVASRVRFLFTGFVRGRVRPAHYSKPPGQAPNIYMLNLYELYYLCFHCDLKIEVMFKTRVKFASLFFLPLLYPWMRLCSLVAIILAEKDARQRHYNRQFLQHMFHPALLLSDNIVVKARKVEAGEAAG